MLSGPAAGESVRKWRGWRFGEIVKRAGPEGNSASKDEQRGVVLLSVVGKIVMSLFFLNFLL